MKESEIKMAIHEARRFVDLAENMLRSIKDSKREYNGHTYYSSCPRESGACRRASLDLTRQLAKMRKP